MTPTLQDQEALIAYLESCVRRRDWRGVADAACDLRVMEAEMAAIPYPVNGLCAPEHHAWQPVWEPGDSGDKPSGEWCSKCNLRRRRVTTENR